MRYIIILNIEEQKTKTFYCLGLFVIKVWHCNLIRAPTVIVHLRDINSY